MIKPEKKERKRRSGKLVIVESPAKAKTVGRFLGKGYVVKASVGHVRDLLRSELSVDVENEFTPKYRVPNEKRVVVKELKALAKDAEQIYLATDPDREGEAICWHLQELLKPSAPQARFHRAEFHEITKSAIQKAIATPGNIDESRVAAQQARRVIDRIVGYEVSDLLWKKVWRGLSAGRVQTVALRIIVEREAERERFRPVPYFSVPLQLAKGEALFPARTVVWRGEKLRFDGTAQGGGTRSPGPGRPSHYCKMGFGPHRGFYPLDRRGSRVGDGDCVRSIRSLALRCHFSGSGRSVFRLHVVSHPGAARSIRLVQHPPYLPEAERGRRRSTAQV